MEEVVFVGSGIEEVSEHAVDLVRLVVVLVLDFLLPQEIVVPEIGILQANELLDGKPDEKNQRKSTEGKG